MSVISSDVSVCSNSSSSLTLDDCPGSIIFGGGGLDSDSTVVEVSFVVVSLLFAGPLAFPLLSPPFLLWLPLKLPFLSP